VETIEELMKRTLIYEGSSYYHWRAGRPRYTLCGLPDDEYALKPVGETEKLVCPDCEEITKRIEKGWSS
jgi:hypothetical protein